MNKKLRGKGNNKSSFHSLNLFVNNWRERESSVLPLRTLGQLFILTFSWETLSSWGGEKDERRKMCSKQGRAEEEGERSRQCYFGLQSLNDDTESFHLLEVIPCLLLFLPPSPSLVLSLSLSSPSLQTAGSHLRHPLFVPSLPRVLHLILLVKSSCSKFCTLSNEVHSLSRETEVKEIRSLLRWLDDTQRVSVIISCFLVMK